ncbi:MAG TPA: PilZ domain-containing protein [Candidatus Limnocylindrales bacterium]|nr:PilZ domain-containing protein [Candidatus Limnocylindrales bacterium]
MTRRNNYSIHRREDRIPMEIPVILEGHRHLPGVESTFTENVSARGARVVSIRHWDKGAQLVLASRTGEFRSSARVAYCQSLHGNGYAVGLEFLEPKGRWVVDSAN